ncbi:DUF3500 domain-containing protein [Geodermatophilus sp. SYSU D00965]
MTTTPAPPTPADERRPLLGRFTRPLVGSLAALALLGTAVACGTAEDTTASTSTTSTSSGSTSPEVTTAAAEGSPTAEVVAAAEAFTATLSDDQLDTLLYDYADSDAKSNWSNLPEGMVQRNGLAMGDLTDEQRTAALAVLQAVLSDEGYQQVLEMMAADDVLAASGSSGGGPGGGLDWSSDNYFIAFFGRPATDSAFMVQFGGHHLAVDVDYAGDTVAITPEFVGIEPQTWQTDDGTTLEPLGSMKDSVFAALSGLSEDQLATAELDQLYDDVVMGAGQDGASYPDDGGVLVSDLSQRQQDLVTAAIREWVGDVDEEVADQVVAEYVAAYDQTYVSWSGSTDSDGEDAYFRISGPRVWIEYVHQSGIGFDGVHLHTVYRDKATDYGSAA